MAHKLTGPDEAAKQHRHCPERSRKNRVTDDFDHVQQERRQERLACQRSPEQPLPMEPRTEPTLPRRLPPSHHPRTLFHDRRHPPGGEFHRHVDIGQPVATGCVETSLASADEIRPPEPGLEPRTDHRPPRTPRSHAAIRPRADRGSRPHPRTSQRHTSATTLVLHPRRHHAIGRCSIDAERNHRASRDIVKPGQRRVCPPGRRFPARREEMDHIAGRGLHAGRHASNHPRPRRGTDKPHLVGEIPGIVVLAAERHDDLATLRTVFEDAEKRLFERPGVTRRRDHDRQRQSAQHHVWHLKSSRPGDSADQDPEARTAIVDCRHDHSLRGAESTEKNQAAARWGCNSVKRLTV